MRLTRFPRLSISIQPKIKLNTSLPPPSNHARHSNPPAPRDYFVYVAMTDTTPCTWTLTVSEESHCNGRGVVIYTADGAECQCDDGYAGVLCEVCVCVCTRVCVHVYVFVHVCM